MARRKPGESLEDFHVRAAENQRAYRLRNLERFRTIQKESKRRHPETEARRRKTRSMNPEYERKHRAHRLVYFAVKRGKISRSPFCQLCWDVVSRLEGHHCNYDLPLEVVWLCRSCHLFVDRGKLTDWRKTR